MSNHKPNSSELSTQCCGLFLPERFYLEEHCVHCSELLLHGVILGFYTHFLPFWCVCLSAYPIPSRIAETSNANGSPAWEMPRALIFFTSILPSQRYLVLIPHYMCVLSLKSGLRNGGGEYTSYKTPKSLQMFAFPLCFGGLIGLYLIKQSFWATCILHNQMIPRALWWCLGLEFSVGSLSIFSFTDVPAKATERPVAEASLL